MKLMELLKEARGEDFSCKEGDRDFNDVLRLLDTKGDGLFKEVIRTVTTPQDGEMGRCTAIHIKGGLSSFGYIALQQLPDNV
jgi:hypothetical protein